MRRIFLKLLLAAVFLFSCTYGVALAGEQSTVPTAEENREPAKIKSSSGVLGLVKDVNRLIKAQSMPPQTKEILGYYAEDWEGDDRSLKSVKNNEKTVTAVATFSFQIDREGNVKGRAPKEALNESAKSGIKTLALIHNWAGQGFSRDAVHSVLTNSEAQDNAIKNITKLIVDNGYHGVNIDFENVAPADREALSAFMARLSRALKEKNLLVTMSIPAKTEDDVKHGWSGAFDYATLGKTVDQLMIMSYDEHWFGGPAGPVASLAWVEQVVKYTVSQVPKEKVLMGIGVYGYVWDTVSGKTTRAIPASGALAKIIQTGATVRWDAKANVPYYYYWQDGRKHVVWFESNQSAALKLNLVKQYGLGGIAVWRLGFEADGFWSMVKEKLATSVK
jgi:spore germination protein YaaH